MKKETLKLPRICAVGVFWNDAKFDIQLETLTKLFANRGIKIIKTTFRKWRISRILDVFTFLPINFLRYDVIHIQAFSYKNIIYAMISVFWAKILRKKIVVMYYGGAAHEFFAAFPRLVKAVYMFVDRIVVAGNYVKSAFDKLGLKTTIIPHILQVDAWPYRHRNKAKPNLLWVRHFRPQYNPMMLLRVFQNVKEAYPEALLKIVGTGPLEEKMKQYVTKHMLKDVNFMGRVPDVKLKELFNWADIFVNTTNVDNQPVSVLEAMACGLAVASTDVGGVPDIITPGDTGLISPATDSETMTKNIFQILENDKLVERLSHSGRAFVENTVSPEAIYSQWATLYQNIGYSFP